MGSTQQLQFAITIAPPQPGPRPIIYHRQTVHIVAQEDDASFSMRWTEGYTEYIVRKGATRLTTMNYAEACRAFEAVRV